MAWVVFQVFRFVCAQNKKAPKEIGEKKESCCCECFVSCLLWTVKVESEKFFFKKKREKTLNLPSLNELNSPWRRLNLYLLAAIFGCVLFFLSPFCFLLLCWLMGGPIESSEQASASISWTQDHQGVCHTVALPFTFKSILRQKKNYGISSISPCKYIILKKNPLKGTKILQVIITL